MTGYPADLLDPDLDLEADLGVDTVKQAEVFAAVRARWNLERDDTLQLREFPTLNHVAGWVRGKLGVPEPTEAPSAAADTASIPAAPAPAAGTGPAPAADEVLDDRHIDRGRDDRLPRRPARPRPRPRGRPRRRHRQAGRGLRRRPRPVEPRTRRHPPAARVPHPQPRRRLGPRQARRPPTGRHSGHPPPGRRRGRACGHGPRRCRTPWSATSTRWTRSPGASPRPRCARRPTSACLPVCRSATPASSSCATRAASVTPSSSDCARRAPPPWCSTPARPPTRCSPSWPRGPRKARSPASTGSRRWTTRATSRPTTWTPGTRPSAAGSRRSTRRCATSGRPTPSSCPPHDSVGTTATRPLARHPRSVVR